MPYENTLNLMGYLGSDPEGGYFADGTAHAKLSLACTEKRRGRDGGQIKHTEWFPVLLRGKAAEFALNYLKKGDCVSVWGSIWSRKFNDKQDRERTVYEIRGEKIKFILSKKNTREAKGDNVEDDGGASPSSG